VDREAVVDATVIGIGPADADDPAGWDRQISDGLRDRNLIWTRVAVERSRRSTGDRPDEAQARDVEPAGRRIGARAGDESVTLQIGGHGGVSGVREGQRVRGRVAAVAPLLADVADGDVLVVGRGPVGEA